MISVVVAGVSGLVVVAFVTRCAADVVGLRDRLQVIVLSGFALVPMFIACATLIDPVATVIPGWFALSAVVVAGGHPLPLLYSGGNWLTADIRADAPSFSGWRELTFGLVLIGGWVGLGVLGAFLLR